MHIAQSSAFPISSASAAKHQGFHFARSSGGCDDAKRQKSRPRCREISDRRLRLDKIVTDRRQAAVAWAAVDSHCAGINTAENAAAGIVVELTEFRTSDPRGWPRTCTGKPTATAAPTNPPDGGKSGADRPLRNDVLGRDLLLRKRCAMADPPSRKDTLRFFSELIRGHLTYRFWSAPELCGRIAQIP